MSAKLQQMLNSAARGGDQPQRRAPRDAGRRAPVQIDPNKFDDEDELDDVGSDDLDGEDDIVDRTAGDDTDLDDTGDDVDWTPPTREEWEAAQAKLRRARQQAKKLRQRSTSRDSDADDVDDDDDTDSGRGRGRGQSQRRDRVERREYERDLAHWQERAVRGSAKAALVDRGVDPDFVDLALAKLRPAEIDFDENDEPELDEWLDDMEERYPRLFAPAPLPRTARSNGQSSPGSRRAASGRIDQGAGVTGSAPRRQPSMVEKLGAAFAEGNRRSPLRPGGRR